MLARNSSSSTASETPARTRRLTSGVGEKSRRGASCAAAFALAKALATRTSAARPSRREKGIPVLGSCKGRARGCVRRSPCYRVGCGAFGVTASRIGVSITPHPPPPPPLPPFSPPHSRAVFGGFANPFINPSHSPLGGLWGQARGGGVHCSRWAGREDVSSR